MKKALLTTIALATFAGATLSSFAQGTVAFANGSATFAIMDGTTSAKVFGNNAFEFGLYMGPSGSSASSLTLVATAFNANSTSAQAIFAGLFNGGNPLTVASLTAGTTYAFQVRGWSANLGNSYEAALASSAITAGSVGGVSSVGSVTAGSPSGSGGNIPVGTLFGTGAGQVGGFTLNQLTPTPEPSTIALGAIGVGALALIRRRK